MERYEVLTVRRASDCAVRNAGQNVHLSLQFNAFGNRPMAERGRDEQRVNSRPAGDQDMHILRSVGDADVIRIANFCEPAFAPVMQALRTAFGKTAQRNSRAVKHRPSNCFLSMPSRASVPACSGLSTSKGPVGKIILLCPSAVIDPMR